MIPRPQHFGDRAPFPVYRSGIVRIFEQPLVRSSPPLRWRPRPLPREAASRKHRGSPSRQALRRRGRNRRSRPARWPEPRRFARRIPRSGRRAGSTPSPDASSRTRSCVSGLPRGVSARIGRPSATLSTAAASTSGFSTIPAPPPAGVSSTLRCLSVAKSRMLHRVERPDAFAQRAAGQADAQRPRKHLRVKRQDGSAEGHGAG